MRDKFVKSTKMFFCLTISIFIMLSMMITVDSLQAQSKGRVTGRVIDANTKEFLPGANVMIVGTSYGSATDRAGMYRIDNVPPGTYTMKVSYIGYEELSTEITVTAGSTLKQDMALKVSYVEMEEVVVQGLREGQIKALSQQRVASNIKNVISEEQMQRFPDLNTTEVLQRIPGVTITRDQGEGRYVLIRGTEARLNNVTVNGQMVASPEDAERYVGLDVVGANQFSSIPPVVY